MHHATCSVLVVHHGAEARDAEARDAEAQETVAASAS